MKKFVLVFTLLVVLALTIPVVAEINLPLSGTRISLMYDFDKACCSIYLGETCDGKLGHIEYPANEPFHVIHGWGTDNFTGQISLDNGYTRQEWAINRADFNSSATAFELSKDGELEKFIPVIFIEDGWKRKLFLSNYKDGLTGTVEFRGYWFQPACSWTPPDWIILTPPDCDLRARVPIFECRVEVEFTE